MTLADPNTIGNPARYTVQKNEVFEKKIFLFVPVHIKTISSKFRILNPKNSQVILQ